MNYSQDVPLQEFRPFTGEEVSFVISPFRLLDPEAQSASPHRHAFYELLYLSDGEGRHVIDFEPYSLHPPMFFFVSPGQVHFWELTRPLQGYAIIFPEEFLIFPSSDFNHAHAFAFFYSVGQTPYLCLAQQDMPGLNALLQTMEQEYGIVGPHRASVLRAYLHILIVQIERLYTSTHDDNHSQTASSLVRQFKQLVSESFITIRSVQKYADKIGVSASHLSDTIKAVTGRSPGQLIRQEIALEARRLLAHTDLTAAEIGYRLNFEDPAYFGRFFKRETGHSPTAFRQYIREKYQIIRA